jgi:hypothetical protein
MKLKNIAIVLCIISLIVIRVLIHVIMVHDFNIIDIIDNLKEKIGYKD